MRERCRRRTVDVVAAVVVTLLTTIAWSDPAPPGDAAPDPGANVPKVPTADEGTTARGGIFRWFNPATAPFIPVPEIAVDPDSGTTLGLIPTWIKTDENDQVRRIVAPDILHNPYFGYGVHGRIYAYSSADEQWSIIAGIKERVERKVDAEYQVGRSRDERWSIDYRLLYDRDGTPRFYGIGNETQEGDETNYTSNQEMAQIHVGLNFTHAWQLLYTARIQIVDVLPGTLDKVASIGTRFGNVLGIGTNKELLNRLSLVYDTRDDLTVPSRGVKWVAYSGIASKHGLFNDSLFSEAGIDGRAFWPVRPETTIAAHLSLRYMPTAHDIPFWALSAIGGGQSDTGGGQQLRGYGGGRFYDHDSFSATVEVRHKLVSINAITTKLDLEVAPFIDVGRVFSSSGTNPLEQLHKVYGVGFRGIARPFVVGYVDIGRGDEGVAVFTGLNYPF